MCVEFTISLIWRLDGFLHSRVLVCHAMREILNNGCERKLEAGWSFLFFCSYQERYIIQALF